MGEYRVQSRLSMGMPIIPLSRAGLKPWNFRLRELECSTQRMRLHVVPVIWSDVAWMTIKVVADIVPLSPELLLIYI